MGHSRKGDDGGGNAHDRAVFRAAVKREVQAILSRGKELERNSVPSSPEIGQNAVTDSAVVSPAPKDAKFKWQDAFAVVSVMLAAAGFAEVPAWFRVTCFILSAIFCTISFKTHSTWPKAIRVCLILVVWLLMGSLAYFVLTAKSNDFSLGILFQEIGELNTAIKGLGTKTEIPQSFPPRALAGSPQQHEGIQFAGIGSTTNNNSVPPVTSWFFRFRVVDGPVSHVKIPTLGYQVAPRLEIPRMTSKFYRAFEHKITIEKDIPEMPDVLQNGEGLQIPPATTSFYNPHNLWTETFIFARAEWEDKTGVPHKIDICSLAHSQTSVLDANTTWEICQVFPPSAIESKLESMPSKQLIETALKVSAIISKNDVEYSRQLAVVKQNFPIEDVAQGQAISAMQHNLFSRFASEECPQLQPLAEEMLFRLSYSLESWLSIYQQANPGAFPDVSAEQLQQQADGPLQDAILGCEKFHGFTFQQSPALGKGLSILTIAFREATNYNAESPFGSRPLR